MLFFTMGNTQSASSFDRLSLCRVLWGWPDCSICDRQKTSNSACTESTCPGNRLKSLEPFFQYYEDTAASYVPELRPGIPAALSSHSDLFSLISYMKDNPSLPRQQLVRDILDIRRGTHNAPIPTDADQNRALLTALKVMAMMDCSSSGSFTTGSLTNKSLQNSSWALDCSYTGLWDENFPPKACPELEENPSSHTIQVNLSARKLAKIGGLKLTGTSDLRNHLRLDTKSGTLEIYHYTSVLKEHLYETKHHPHLPGNIPRPLALETLDTIYTILFPFTDAGSQSILRRLIAKEGFDPDCRRSASAAYRRPDEQGQSFKYWGTRMMDLYDEVDNPAPRSHWEKWLQRKNGARYVMMATLVGVATAVLLGFLGLAVGIFQAWVAYQQWKYPVSSS